MIKCSLNIQIYKNLQILNPNCNLDYCRFRSKAEKKFKQNCFFHQIMVKFTFCRIVQKID
ncbi:unnamed protein product [Paramecium pentaurelia]|uniref:Uncharacterized protein n=1 Tax=Paramecium pentaurelia TaxID=43138 RepID=A0A8S1UZW8_9CILI|nr:unnamed protein product [Paramecium pentaurelia]